VTITPLLGSDVAELPAVPYARPVAEVADALGVDPKLGLSADDVAARRGRWGRNELEEPDPRPKWLLFADQFRNVLVALLVVGAIVAGAIGDLKDSIAIAVVLVFNASLGYLQEQKASKNLAALREMLALTTRVRRGGMAVEVPTSELVPGDVVLVEAGDRIPADARVIEAWAAEIDESSLTGESLPVGKRPGDVIVPDAPLGDRSTMVLMNTQVSQGRLVAVVTATGMDTEVGKVAALIAESGDQRTPLQRQLDSLGKRLAAISGAVVLLYFALGLLRGNTVSETLISAVALLVAAIPEGLPAVVTLTLAVGTSRLAKRGAIVKRLASVETLGSTSVICSDKTGTLTMNQMTARAVWTPAGELRVAGQGYETTERIIAPPRELVALAEIAVLCNDSDVRDNQLIGDPTEGALVVLADKAGVDVDAVRAAVPRVAEVPFDSARKFMLTINHGSDGDLMAVKGAWEVVADRCTHVGATDHPFGPSERMAVTTAARTLAGEGLRVLAVASRPAPDGASELDVDQLVAATSGLVFHGLVGLLDPPRNEVPAAIAVAVQAGIEVKMVTGDHLDTARAIASQIGIVGEAISGQDLDGLDDDQLAERIDHVGVIARVSPQHKVRIVRALRQRNAVVAMTGDGVNDAAALSVADIGVAMGISGTEVAKDAADMVLADDNFATITSAVEQGRTIYNNIIKFVRFQLATNIGALCALIGAQIVNLPVPFNPIQLLWINLIMDGPPAMALGVDPDTPGEMDHPPRGAGQQILSRRRLGEVAVQGLVMAAATLGVLAWADHRYGTERALTLAFTTFVLMQVVNALNVRDEQRSLFTRATLTNRSLYIALAGVVILQVLAVQLQVGQNVFGTTTLTFSDWAIAAGLALTLALIEETTKAVRRRRPAPTQQP
jgi:Ca2+-transporting ATPase